MKSVILKTSDNKRLYVNPDRVECIQEVSADKCYLNMSSGDSYSVQIDAHTVASMLCARADSETKFVSCKDWADDEQTDNCCTGD